MTTWGSGIWKSTDIAIGATTDLGGVTTFRARLIAGSGPVTSFGTRPNCYRVVRCAVDVAITPSASLLVPGAASTFHANDSFVAMSDSGGNWIIINIERYSSADAVADLGLGTMSVQNANAVAITGGSIINITDLAIADGGTGASTQAGARTALGLAIGTDVQAFDVDLSALAGLAIAADTLPYGNGAHTMGLAAFTAAGRALIDDASAAAQLVTLGAAPFASSATIATDADFTLTPGSSAENTKHTGTLTADRAVTLSTAGAIAGSRFFIERSGSGAFVLNVGSGLAKLAQYAWAEFLYDGSAWYLASSSSRIAAPQLITAATTFAVPWDPAGFVSINFSFASSGGAGGGVAAASAAAASGCPGWTGTLRLRLASGTSVTVTPGAGGTGGAAGNNAGSNGVDTTIAVSGGATYTIPGGIGGGGSASGNTNTNITVTSAAINAQFATMRFTETADAFWVATPVRVAGASGATGAGGAAQDNVHGVSGASGVNANGAAATGYSAAGAGAASTGASAWAGGNGAPAIVHVSY